jgi:hypothetical protein
MAGKKRKNSKSLLFPEATAAKIFTYLQDIKFSQLIKKPVLPSI